MKVVLAHLLMSGAIIWIIANSAGNGRSLSKDPPVATSSAYKIPCQMYPESKDVPRCPNRPTIDREIFVDVNDQTDRLERRFAGRAHMQVWRDVHEPTDAGPTGQ